MSWIVIPNWDRFQHYTDRTPPWIKLYLELNSNDEWCELSLSARGLLVTLWVEYGRSRGQIKVSAIPQICRQKVLRKTLESLNDAGLIKVVASRPLALARSREVEVEKEKKKTRSAHAQKAKEPRSNAAAYQPFNPADADDDYVPLEQLETYAMSLKQQTT
jgi:hypothetical protein